MSAMNVGDDHTFSGMNTSDVITSDVIFSDKAAFDRAASYHTTSRKASTTTVTKPADRLNIILQRLKHPAPTYATEEYRLYRVKIHLSAPTLDLISAPDFAPFQNLVRKAYAGSKATSPLKSKVQGMTALCDVLDMVVAAKGALSGGSKGGEEREVSKIGKRGRKRQSDLCGYESGIRDTLMAGAPSAPHMAGSPITSRKAGSLITSHMAGAVNVPGQKHYTPSRKRKRTTARCSTNSATSPTSKTDHNVSDAGDTLFVRQGEFATDHELDAPSSVDSPSSDSEADHLSSYQAGALLLQATVPDQVRRPENVTSPCRGEALATLARRDETAAI